MMKNFTCLLMLGVMAMVANGQDTIFRSDGTRTLAKIIAAGKSSIHYQPWGDTTGIEFVIDNAFVDKVSYANGKKETIDHTVIKPPAGYQVAENQEHKIYRNQFSLSISDLGFNMFSVEYLRLIPSKSLAVRVPLSVGFGLADNNYYDMSYYHNKSYSTGLAVYYYPVTHTWFDAYLGPAFELGRFMDISDSYESRTNRRFTSLLLFIGGNVVIKNQFVIGLNIGSGRKVLVYDIKTANDNINNYKDRFPDNRCWLSFGFKF